MDIIANDVCCTCSRCEEPILIGEMYHSITHTQEKFVSESTVDVCDAVVIQNYCSFCANLFNFTGIEPPLKKESNFEIQMP